MSTETIITDVRSLKTTNKMLQWITEDAEIRSITQSKERIDDDLAHSVIMNIENIGPNYTKSRKFKKERKMIQLLIKYCVHDRNIDFSDYLSDMDMGTLMLFQMNR